MNFNTDTSTQSITSLSLITGSYNGVATKADVNLKQDLLTASTTLLGIGSSISALDFNKITLNKPTNFQSDWNSTIINKPTNFQSDWNSTIINKPTNFQSDWNSTIINKPVIYTQTEVNNISNLCSNYTTQSSNNNSNFTYVSSNILNTKINTKQDILTYYPIDPAIYYNKTQTDTLLNVKEQILTFSAPLTRTTNTIGINLNSYVPFTALSASNYITNSTNGLINYPLYTTLNSCNYITNANNTLIYYPSYTVLNSCNYITNATSGLVNYYTKTSIDSSLATKEAILTFNAPLSRSVNAISIDLTNYYTKTQDDTLSNNNSNYTYNSSNILNNKINLYLTSNGGSLTGDLNTNSKFLTTNNTNFGIPTVSTTGTGDKIIFTNGGTNFYPNSIGLENAGSLWISSCNNLKFYNNSINSMTIQGNGAVGIGTTQNFNNASYKLDVRGDLIASSLSTIDNNKNWVSYITTSTSGFTNFQTAGVSLAFQPDLNIQPLGGHLFLGNNNPTSNVFINSSKVGIGTTSLLSTSTWKLDVRGYIGTNAIYVAENANYGGNQYQLMITPPSSTSSAGIQTIQQNVNFSQKLSLQALGGNVGIGVVSPNNVFQVGSGGRLRIANDNTDYTLIGANDVDNTSNTRIIISGYNRTGGLGSIEYVATNTGNHIFYTSGTTERLRILNNGNIGIGTYNTNGTLELYSTTQLIPRIILSGQEFYTNTTIVSGGIALICGVNRTGNRQLWIGDSLNLAQNTTNQILRLGVSGIDCIATNGTTSLPIFYGNGGAQTAINGSSIYLNGNTGVGTDAPRTKMDIYNGDLVVRSAGEGGISTLYLGTPFETTSAFKCALIARGVSSFSRCKFHICLNNVANNSTLYNAIDADARLTIDYFGNVGIGNTFPLSDSGTTTYFTVGNSSNAGSEGAIVIQKKNYTGGTRHYKFGITSDFYWGIGDFGNNNTIGTWLTQIICNYSAPANSILIDSIGRVYGNFINTSDERIKTNIRNIDNALDKVLLLEGKNYTLIEENTEEIGLIAQDVEKIVPEAIKECSKTNLKAINYQGLVGLLIEAIKDQQKQINELKTILKKNNLY